MLSRQVQPNTFCFDVVNQLIYLNWPLVVVLCSGLLGLWIGCCLHFKVVLRSCAIGGQWCGIFQNHWWTFSIKRRLLFPNAGFAFWGLFLFLRVRNLYVWAVQPTVHNADETTFSMLAFHVAGCYLMTGWYSDLRRTLTLNSITFSFSSYLLSKWGTCK